VIGREARRLGDLVENILLFSHIDASRARLEPERTDLGELVEEAVEAYVPLAASRRMRIVADAPSRIYAVVDPHALRQVVVNLIDNALKYGPAGQTVHVEVERDGAWARLSVCDEGPGVAPGDRARLWRPFVRLGTGGSTVGGSGIGLSVVRSLVLQHGGRVAVEGAPGGGARFVVALPLATGAPLTPPPLGDVRADVRSGV
jgi:signal transduction histidine kinase